MLKDLFTIFWCLTYLGCGIIAIWCAWLGRFEIATFLLVLALHIGRDLDAPPT